MDHNSRDFDDTLAAYEHDRGAPDVGTEPPVEPIGPDDPRYVIDTWEKCLWALERQISIAEQHGSTVKLTFQTQDSTRLQTVIVNPDRNSEDELFYHVSSAIGESNFVDSVGIAQEVEKLVLGDLRIVNNRLVIHQCYRARNLPFARLERGIKFAARTADWLEATFSEGLDEF